ncbi:hypothetical protein GWI72_01305 [Microvirga tunisiensis]|uniref:RiboL-PSP-HEPN domain-containing protein n=1 Tax=Pannonibacter tanglangensis TaxID=2750084 RepID=A0A7X5F1T6_9HYPH|nr:hypothetical protein [Pannonibacter sp. XCT-53]NBN76899.1 hypothetical protein [Pannonibacter sp. XCT-53]
MSCAYFTDNDRAQAFVAYKKRAGVALLEACSIFDHAVASEKMLSWQCLGGDNKAWSVGPYLSAGAGEEQIDHSRPYCLILSLETSVAASLVLGGERPRSNGGILVPAFPAGSSVWKAERLVAKLAIIEQFEIYRDYAIDSKIPYSSKIPEDYRCVDQSAFEYVFSALRGHVDRRNELIHADECAFPTMREAVEYYNVIIWIADEFLKLKS